MKYINRDYAPFLKAEKDKLMRGCKRYRLWRKLTFGEPTIAIFGALLFVYAMYQLGMYLIR